MPGQRAGAAPPDWSQAETIKIDMIDDKFVPPVLTLRVGVVYRLQLQNTGKELHEFTAPAFFTHSLLRDPHQLANGGQDIVVQSGTRVDVFLIPQQPGSYRLICADHDWAGMTGAIVVQ